MAYYAVVLLTPKSEAWVPDYVAAVTPLLAKHGGKYLARTASHERLAGTGPNPGLIVLIEWPSKESAEAFYRDPAYQSHLQSLLGGDASDLFIVEGKDDLA